ncbi:hypothetical protein V9T40_002252 [Parthenolecanium corni]|uniref:Uncharacterized protein n=1 Tax=Parthenolecanium corni TaxID=536013 RepID=A0AAN9TK73_9HEMI
MSLTPSNANFDFPCLFPTANSAINYQIGNTVIQHRNFLDGRRPRPLHLANNNPTGEAPTRHHVIPYNTFAAFLLTLNTLASSTDFNLNERDYLSRTMSVLSDHYVRRVHRNEILNFSYDSRANFLTSGTAYLNPDFVRRSMQTVVNQNLGFAGGNVVEQNSILINTDLIFSTMVMWIPGNIFFGPEPELRDDDPGEGFEVNSRNIIGDDRFEQLVSLHTNINDFNRNHDRNLFETILTQISQLCELNEVPFNIDQWEVTGTRRVRRNGREIDRNTYKIKIPQAVSIQPSTTPRVELKRSAGFVSFCYPDDLNYLIMKYIEKIDDKINEKHRTYKKDGAASIRK